MARRDHRLFPVFEDLNLLLFSAWEHGARHVALRAQGDGTEIQFLGPDGAEHRELLSLPYEHLVRHLRQMTARSPRVHLDMGGRRWQMQAAIPGSRSPQRVFLHMRADDE